MTAKTQSKQSSNNSMRHKYTLKAMLGAHAAAYAMKQINPEVVAMYPITPQTPIIEKFSEYVADGVVDSELIRVESEHSAMSACVGAAAAGGRVMTATAANGLALMTEIVYIAASSRLPIVMNIADRALSGPINIHCDHSDVMLERDSGWIMLFSENAQEVYENNLFALKLAEQVKLPAMIMEDGFITSHALEEVNVINDSAVKKWIGEYKPEYPLLNTEKPVTYGPLDLFDYYFEHKYQQHLAMEEALKIFPKLAKEFKRETGYDISEIESYKMNDAELAILSMNSSAGTVKSVVDDLRSKGLKVGALKLRLFRPFPRDKLVKAIRNIRALAVLDRSLSFGSRGPLYLEVKESLYGKKNILLTNFIYGLGGRDFTPEMVYEIFEYLNDAVDKKSIDDMNFIGVRK